MEKGVSERTATGVACEAHTSLRVEGRDGARSFLRWGTLTPELWGAGEEESDQPCCGPRSVAFPAPWTPVRTVSHRPAGARA